MASLCMVSVESSVDCWVCTVDLSWTIWGEQEEEGEGERRGRKREEEEEEEEGEGERRGR